MEKKIAFFLSSLVVAMAVEVVVMPNGKAAIIKPDGTWEEVTLAKMGDKTIALKKDGSWEEVTSQLKTIKPVVKSQAVIVEGGNTAIVSESKAPLPPFAKGLIGHWKGDNIEYIFYKDYKMTIVKNGEKEDMDFTVAGFDAQKRIIRIGLGKRFKIGPASFGGKIIKLKISEDGRKLYDITNSIENFEEVQLIKVGANPTPKHTKVSKKKKSEKSFFRIFKDKVTGWIK
jgi:hypothetical protein